MLLHRFYSEAGAPLSGVEVHQLGRMDKVCRHCLALLWAEELALDQRRRAAPSGHICCKRGKVSLPDLQPLPELLASLMDGRHVSLAHFLSRIRRYNCAF